MSRFFFLIREALVNLRRNLLVVAGAVLAVFVSLGLVFGALVAKEVLRISTLAWKEGVHVIAFLNDAGVNGVPPNAHEQLYNEVLGWDEVKSATYVDKGQAWLEYQQLFAGQPDMLEINPEVLPASIRIELVDLDLYQSVVFRLNQQPLLVRRVIVATETIRQIQDLSNALNIGIVGVSVVLGLAAVVLIANTIRLAIYARRDEVSIMRLVGASNWYIRIPFLLEGLIEAVVGAAVAVFTVWLLGSWLADVMRNFALFHFNVSNAFYLRWGLTIFLFGGVAGVLGSLLGLSRYLRESEGIGPEVPTGSVERV